MVTEESPSSSTTISVSSGGDISSDTSVSFQKRPRSAVWKHFRRHKRSAQCLLCMKILSYNGGTTSNLIQHLNMKPQLEVEVQKFENTENSEPKAKQVLIIQFGNQRKGKFINRPYSVETKKK